MMNKWRRPRFLWLALLAMFSLVTPSSAWNCVSATQAAPTCPLMTEHRTAETVTEAATMDGMSCCAPAKTVVQCPQNCCQSSPQFPGSDHKGGTLEKAHAAGTSAAQHLAQAAQNTVVIAATPSAPLVIEPLQTREWAEAAPLLFKSQFAPATQAGRAPPLQ